MKTKLLFAILLVCIFTQYNNSNASGFNENITLSFKEFIDRAMDIVDGARLVDRPHQPCQNKSGRLIWSYFDVVVG